MDSWNIAFAINGAFLGVLLFLWKMVKEVKDDLIDSIQETDKKVVEVYKHVEAVYTRKDTHAIEYSHILATVNDTNRKLDKMYEELKKGQ